MDKVENRKFLSSLIEKAQRYARAYYRTIGPVDPQDLAQMAVIKLVQNSQNVRHPMSYLYRVIRSVAIDTARKYARETRNTVPPLHD